LVEMMVIAGRLSLAEGTLVSTRNSFTVSSPGGRVGTVP